jgi:hypothetical protein
MTIGEYLNRTNKDFVRYGRRAKWFAFLGKLTRSKKYIDKAVYYWDKRWKIMMDLLE